MAWLEIGRTGLTAMLLHPWRSAATIACVLAVLVPYLTGLGISGGLSQQAEESLRYGADLYVAGRQFGRAVPLPLEAIEKIAAIPGVSSVVPRIVGPVVLGRERHSAVVVGIAPDKLADAAGCIEGKLFHEGPVHELVVGSALAAKLKLKVGARLPPFYRNRKGERVSQVVGIFTSDAPLWQANLVFTSFDSAAAIFDQQGLATDLLVYCRAGERDQVAASIRRQVEWIDDRGGTLGVRVGSRDDLESLATSAALHRDGIFHLHCVLACSVAVLAVFVTSGFGSSERRREVGILKAVGWQTDEVLLRSAVESLLLTLGASSLSVLVTWAWLRGFNGYGIAGLFLPGLDVRPGIDVPFRLVPVPLVLSVLLSWVVVTSGGLYATWRTATTPPAEAMR
ncbi:MAG TPA: FtsX-like permease family protein [Pirellulales bacterium]|jgi:ABC-type lipoprotein release transport system permease subunit|nr:FtsX-like permease family protein [Pirellulales bacterium]